jgi:hypothetical protein
MYITIKLVARGDNGYRCSCCGQSWKIEREYADVGALIKDCIDDKKSANEGGDGFEIKSIYLIEHHADGSQTSRRHPAEAEIIKKIDMVLEDEEAA